MITEDMIRDYERDGAICVRQAVTPQVAGDLLRHLDALIAGVTIAGPPIASVDIPIATCGLDWTGCANFARQRISRPLPDR